MARMRLTKIDVAEAHLVTAVRCTFRSEHPAAIYLLASSAREILTTIGSKVGVRTVLHGVAEETGKKLGRLVDAAHEFAGFMKHADRNPTAVIDNFSEFDSDAVLFIACHDFLRVTKGQPVELQVFEAWWFATAYPRVSNAPLRAQAAIKRAISHFPGIRTADRKARAALGLAALEKASLDPRLVMEIEREVRLPPDDLMGAARVQK
jgi:hypothetical protein